MAGTRENRPEKFLSSPSRSVKTVVASETRARQAKVRETRARLDETEGPTRAQIEEAAYYDDRGPRYLGSSDVDLEPSDARITMQLKFMAEQIAELSAALYELEERVQPILLPPFAEPSTPDAPGSATSELSRVIDDHNGSISALIRRVGNINRRVQL